MKRIPENELMDGDEQARAYAGADFSEPHNRFITMFKQCFANKSIRGYALDLGCGPGDISMRFAKAFPDCIVHGVDGAEAMLKYGRAEIDKHDEIKGRVKLIHGLLPDAALPREKYDIIICNSLLHHFHEPNLFWKSVVKFAQPGAPIFIMDLRRPETVEIADNLVKTYTANEPEILKRDFFNSLLAAFTVEEVNCMLKDAGLEHLSAAEAGDRHLIVTGLF